MKKKKIKNLKGILCRSIDGRHFLRVNEADGSFCDYKIVHNDLDIEIQDDDAYAYLKEGEWIIDHSPATLGKEEEEK